MKYSVTVSTAPGSVIKASTNFCLCPLTDTTNLCKLKKKKNQTTQATPKTKLKQQKTAS